MRSWLVPERIENAVIKLNMDGEAYDRLKETVDTTGIIIGRVGKYDNVDLTFEFKIEYFNIVAQLRALAVLLNDPSVSAAMIGSRDELNLLLIDLVDAIRNVQNKLETVESQ